MPNFTASQHRSHRFRSLDCRCSPPPTGLKGFFSSSSYSGLDIVRSPRSDPPRRSRSSPIPISSSRRFASIDGVALFADDVELWAGPAYSNSPPPSSLPMPNFSLCRRRWEKPLVCSAPSSPSSAFSLASSPDEFSFDAVFATRDLCRILNLDYVFD